MDKYKTQLNMLIIVIMITLFLAISNCDSLFQGPSLSEEYWKKMGLEAGKVKKYHILWEKQAYVLNLRSLTLHIGIEGKPSQEEIVATSIQAIREAYEKDRNLECILINVFPLRSIVKGFKAYPKNKYGGGFSKEEKKADVLRVPNTPDENAISERKNYIIEVKIYR